jgi:hypothetical protein
LLSYPHHSILVRFRRFFEFFFGFLIAGVAVGMELHRHFAIGFLDLIRSGGFTHAQYFVKISFGSQFLAFVFFTEMSLFVLLNQFSELAAASRDAAARS